VVTGASAGIGRALALELGSHGADVVAVARTAANLQSLAAAFEPLPGRLHTVTGDVAEPHVRHQCLEVADREFGGLDLLVNNAGVGSLGLFHRARPEELRRVMDVNFFAAAELTREAAGLLRRGRRPMVVNIASVLGYRGVPYAAEYCASKFALVGLSQSLRPELAALGIDLLVVSPGTTATDFHQHSLRADARPPWHARKGQSADVVARLVVRAIAKGRRHLVPSAGARMFLCLQRFAPRLLDWWFGRYGK
jgi:short-subunit dehydrogenase